jgi:CBS domain-containing protein
MPREGQDAHQQPIKQAATPLSRRAGTAQIECAVVLLVIIGLALVVFEAVALTPVHHRIVEAMNQELSQELASGNLGAEDGAKHVLTEYEISASDAKFFWQSLAIGLFVLVLIKSAVVLYHLRRRRKARLLKIQRRSIYDHQAAVFEKRQEMYHAISNEMSKFGSGHFPVSRFMTKQVVSVSERSDLNAVNDVMHEQGIHHLVVVDSANRLKGVISDGDVDHGEGLTAGEIMTPGPYSVNAESDVIPTLTLMLERRINCVPVVSQQHEVLGIVTRTDAIMLTQCLFQWLNNRSSYQATQGAPLASSPQIATSPIVAPHQA